MITHIRMKNFKSWADSGEVQLAPLTGFFGTNSSGKSSLLQMLLLLKQTVDSEAFLFFGDENSLVNLGNFREVIHGHNEEKLLELEFGCKIETPFTIEFLLPDQSGVPTPTSFTTDSFTFSAAISWKKGRVVDDIHYCVKTENKEQVVKVDNNAQKIYGDRYSVNDRDFPITLLLNEFKKLFFHVYYLGPTRVQPQRHYHWEGVHPRRIDKWGGGAIDAVLSAGVRKLKSSNKEDAALIEDRISEWLQKMELAHSFRVIPTEPLDDQNYEVCIQKSPSSVEVTLADMGYGLADVLPMLICFYYVQEGSTLILEQPGIHLHPMVQSQIADLLIEVVNERKLQILVESHSEHLLNRLQRRIAEEKISVDKTALYFCRNDESVSNIERLKMDEFGNISNWPENFFGNEMGDLFAMTEAQSERRKRAEGE